MLIDLPVHMFNFDQVMVRVFAKMNGVEEPKVARVAQGVYDNTLGFPHNFSHLLPKLDYEDEYPGRLSYGVADSWEQVLNYDIIKEEYVDSARRFVMAFEHLRKDKDTGWRWHKWGQYIGVQSPQCEYLSEEPIIEEVITFHFLCVDKYFD
jgi:hypothetical protein